MAAGSGEGGPVRTWYLGLGSNLGDRSAHLAYGLHELGRHGRITGVSSVYESDPVGFAEQPRFYNLVGRLETPLRPRSLLDAVLGIERRRGRVRRFRNAPRPLDIDLLTPEPGGTEPRFAVVEEEGLTLPHPRMTERAFVLVPLLELEPGLVDPRTGRPFAEYLVRLLQREGPDVGGPVRAGELTEHTLNALGLERIMDGTELLENTDA